MAIQERSEMHSNSEVNPFPQLHTLFQPSTNNLEHLTSLSPVQRGGGEERGVC